MSMQTINFDVLNLQQNDRILDLGCGEGRHAISAYMLADVESVGIDLSQKDLTTTRERHQEFLQRRLSRNFDGDFKTLPPISGFNQSLEASVVVSDVFLI